MSAVGVRVCSESYDALRPLLVTSSRECVREGAASLYNSILHNSEMFPHYCYSGASSA